MMMMTIIHVDVHDDDVGVDDDNDDFLKVNRGNAGLPDKTP